MYSFNFPSMLSSVSSNLVEDKEAIRLNIRLVLSVVRRTLFGDPYFGTNLLKTLFEQQGATIVDLVIDEIYTTLVTFIPQVIVNRKDITLTSNGTDMFVTMRLIYRLDNTSDMYTIRLTDNTQE